MADITLPSHGDSNWDTELNTAITTADTDALAGEAAAETEETRAEAAEETKANESDLAAETARAEAAEAGAAAASALAAEVTRAETAEGTDATAVATETTRAMAAESGKATTSALSSETSRAETAEGANASAVSTETTRAEGAEGTNATAISTETSRAETAEALKATASALAAETTRAEAAEAAAASAGGSPEGFSSNPSSTFVWPGNANGASCIQGSITQWFNGSGSSGSTGTTHSTNSSYDATSGRGYVFVATGATSNNLVGCSAAVGADPATIQTHLIEFMVSSFAAMKMFAGVGDGGQNNVIIGSYVYGQAGIRYDTSAGDSTFKVVSNAYGSTTPAVTDTGITPAAGTHYFVRCQLTISGTTPAWKVSLLDSGYNILFSTTMPSVNATAVTSSAHQVSEPCVAIQTLEAVTKQISLFKAAVVVG